MNQQVLVPLLLSELELSIIEFIHEFGFCEINHIMKRFSLKRTFCYEQIKDLKRFELINSKMVLPHHQGIYFLTRKAMKLINTDLPLITYIPTNNYFHYMEVFRVYLKIREKYPDGTWITERRLIKCKHDEMVGTKEHLPDGILVLPGKNRIAIEVELTLKGSERLTTIFTDYSMNKNIHEIWYFCTPKVRSVLQEMSSQFSKIKIHLLDEEKS